MTDRPNAAWLLLPTLVLGIQISRAIGRGDTLALVVLLAVAGVAISGAVAAYVYYRRHPEQVGRDWPTPPLSRRRTLLLAVGVILGLICAVTGLVILIAGNGPLGAVLLILGLLPTLVCGSTLGGAAQLSTSSRSR